MMLCPLLIFSQSDYLILIADTNSHTEWQTVQIQIRWLLQKPTDLDLHCLQRQGISGFSRTRVKLLDLTSTLTWISVTGLRVQFLSVWAFFSSIFKLKSTKFNLGRIQIDLLAYHIKTDICELETNNRVRHKVINQNCSRWHYDFLHFADKTCLDITCDS